jgi:hypothetical protein
MRVTRHQKVALGDRAQKSRFGRQFPYTETSPYVRNAPCRGHFERGLLWYALETDWLAGAGGFEHLHLRIGIRQDSQLGGAGLELAHLE